LRDEKLTSQLFRAVLLSIAISSGTMVATAHGLPRYVNRAETTLPFGSIVLAQAEGNTLTEQSLASDSGSAEENSSDLMEDLLSQFLEDPAGFVADPNNADFIAEIVQQAIAQNPANVDAIIAAVDSSSNSSITEAVAEGIARAAADYAAAGDTAASSQILAKASLATSTGLRQAVRDKTSEIAAETTLSDKETLAEPGAVAPSLSNATGPSGDSGSPTLPSGGAISTPPTVGTTNPLVTVTPPQGGVPASPA
jgi:cell pole-organizing protein PopZ